MASPTGVVFPETSDGVRSTSVTGRAIVADALRAVDPVGARSAEQETNWRQGYLIHFRRLVEAGLQSPDAGRRIATDGLASLHTRMKVRADGEEAGLDDVFDRSVDSAHALTTQTIEGGEPPEREFALPYRGQRLRGEQLSRQLDSWVGAGVIEPSCADTVREVAANPDWLDLSDVRVVAFGAGAEMGPVQAVLRWGGDIVAIDLPRPAIWTRLIELGRRHAGRLHIPVRPGGGDMAERAGTDLLHELPVLAEWLGRVEGRLVLGSYAYADGATHVRVSTAIDALTVRLLRDRPDAALSSLATPTDVFAVPADVVAQSVASYQRRTAFTLLRRPLKVLSGGRLLQRNYVEAADPGICDSLVAQQGPNYALAKRIQRWRATVARAEGRTVSMTVAPPTRTRSVTRNRALAAAYAGAHRFGVEVFDPGTANTLMAALLVHDLRVSKEPNDFTWQDEAARAAHGGIWRSAYAPRSALGLAAVVGIGGART